MCRLPHPVLRAKAALVEAFTDETRRLAQRLIQTMYANDGIGLAAPQVGVGVQLFVANPSHQRGHELIVANPVLDLAKGSAGIVEGCLSVPDVWERVKRAARVRMTGRDEFGKPLVIEANGLLAIVLQHEFDHLQGRLFIDRLSWLKRRRLSRNFASQHFFNGSDTPLNMRRSGNS